MNIPFAFPWSKMNSIETKEGRLAIVGWQNDNSFRTTAERGAESCSDTDVVGRIPIWLATSKRRLNKYLNKEIKRPFKAEHA